MLTSILSFSLAGMRFRSRSSAEDAIRAMSPDGPDGKKYGDIYVISK